MRRNGSATRAKRPSTYDVARLAGVSRTTVSFVVNDRPNANIPDETRERVWAAVAELNWRPNAIARGLSSQRSHTIGFLSDEIATTPAAGQMIRGAQDAAWSARLMLLVIDTGRNAELEQAAMELLLERQVESIIYATMYHRPVQLPAGLGEVPVVLLDCFTPDGSVASVVPDEVQGGRAAVESLLALGHRRIGFINNSDPIPASSGRLQGYQQALAAAEVPFEPALVRPAPPTARGAYEATLALMAQPHPPTALFCASDVMALGAYNALHTLQLRIPDDVAVVGFDNQELVAAHLDPGLSTMALPHYAMGQWAVQYLLDERPLDAPPTQQRLPCQYIARGST